MQKQKNKQTKVLITGGHAGSTAYAVIREIRKQGKNWKLSWIGSKTAMEGKKVATLEAQSFPRLGVDTYTITTGRIQRKLSLWTIPSLMKIPLGFFQAFYLINKIQPDVILSFGGYAAFPVVVSAWIHAIPVIVHEQTTAAGAANRFSSPFARKIALARESSAVYFQKKKCVITGNPVEPEILKIKAKTSLPVVPTVLITGGLTGSVSINDACEKILQKLIRDYKVIHQTGAFQYQKFEKIKRILKRPMDSRYEVYGFIPPEKWPDFLKKADIIVSRAGANIISQVMVVKRPAIAIPIPFASLDEQKKNAQYAEDFGLVRIIEQKDLKPETLLSGINQIKRDWRGIMFNVSEKKSPDYHASENLVGLINTFI